VPAAFVARSQLSHLGSLFGPDTALAPGSEGEGDTAHEIVRRIVRRHIDEVKACYAQELSRQPKLAGRIDVRFTVAASGQISAASVQRSTMGNARVEGCTVEAVRRWAFPPPLGGGSVVIAYPFVFTPSSDAGAADE